MFSQRFKDNFLLGVLLAFGFMVGFVGFSIESIKREAPNAPVLTPAAPPAVAPVCPCKAEPCPPAQPARPFQVVCPFCRNTMTVQPPPVGNVGSSIGDARSKPVVGQKPFQPPRLQ